MILVGRQLPRYVTFQSQACPQVFSKKLGWQARCIHDNWTRRVLLLIHFPPLPSPFLIKIIGFAVTMSIAAKPDPIGIDSSRLLEGEITADHYYDMEKLPPSITSTPENQTRKAMDIPTPPMPKRPPGSVVGGCGIPKLSKVWTSETRAVTIVQSVEFKVLQKGMDCYLRFLITERPASLQPYITQEEWTDLRNKVDEIGMRVIWDVNRSLILLVVLFFIIVIVNTGDEIGGTFALGDVQISILIVLGVIFLKMLWDECYENYTRRVVFHEMDVVCREYSDMMRPRGVCVAFRFVDNDDFGLLVDLAFYKVQTAQEVMLSIP